MTPHGVLPTVSRYSSSDIAHHDAYLTMPKFILSFSSWIPLTKHSKQVRNFKNFAEDGVLLGASQEIVIIGPNYGFPDLKIVPSE